MAAAVLVLAMAPAAWAQKLTLTVSPANIQFASADPDAVPTIASAPVSVVLRVQQNVGQTWQLTVAANGDLVSGPSTIDISTVSWTANPAPPFRNGTLNKTVAQLMASGTGNALGSVSGSITFRVANSWTYDAGTYTQTIVFTLTAP
jgi:hypothetical protein